MLHHFLETTVALSAYTTRYSSAVTNASTEKSGDPSPLILSIDVTATPATLPCPMKLTSTGKNAPTSTPPTLNISEPDLDSSEGDTTGIDHARECEEGSRDHSAVCDETVGYEPSLEIRWKINC